MNALFAHRNVQARPAFGVRPFGIGYAMPRGIGAGLLDAEVRVDGTFQLDTLVNGDSPLPVTDGLVPDAQGSGNGGDGEAAEGLFHAPYLKVMPKGVKGIAYNQPRLNHGAMKSGKELGQAIALAVQKKGITKSALAKHFKVAPSSVHDWITKGVIAKEKLPELWRFFSDAVGPEHWGLDAYPWQQSEPAPRVSPDRWRHWADLLAAELARRGVQLDPAMFLDFVDAVAADNDGTASEREASAVFERLWPLIKRGARLQA